MATASIKATAVVTLMLTVEEAEFIRSITQNTWYESLEDEPQSIRDRRYAIFTELNNALNSLHAEIKGHRTT
jgi:hypothetical protein